MTLSETHKKLKYIEAHRTVSRALVFKWRKRYTYGFKDTKQKKERPAEGNRQQRIHKAKT